MKTPADHPAAAASGRSAAQLAGGHHGRSAAVVAAATPLDEETPVQRAALTSAHGRQVAQLREIVTNSLRQAKPGRG